MHTIESLELANVCGGVDLGRARDAFVRGASWGTGSFGDHPDQRLGPVRAAASVISGGGFPIGTGLINGTWDLGSQAYEAIKGP